MKDPTERLSPSSPVHAAFSPLAAAPSGPLAGAGVPGYHKSSLHSFTSGAVPIDPLEFSPGLKSLAFPTNELLYLYALDAAIELLRGDGGVLATLEPTGQRLIVRCQRASGPLAAHYSALAALGSQPRLPGAVGYVVEERQALELEKTQPLPMFSPTGGVGGAASVPPASALVPSLGLGVSAGSLPVGGAVGGPPFGYAKGHGVLGHIWQMNQALTLSSEKCRLLPRDETTPADQEAPWHLGAPIRAPQPLIPLGGSEPAPVVGVITVSIQDSHWSSTRRHIELLQLHADRVALALQAAWLEETRAHQGKFLHLLHDASLHFSTTLNRDQLFAELHELAIASLGATSFAVLLAHPETQEVEFGYIAERDGAPERQRLKEAQMPDWWRMVKDGTLVNVSTPEQRRQYAHLLKTGWRSERASESILIVPMLTKTREQIIGALLVASDSPQAYMREQVEMLGTIARTAAFALENAELHHRSERSQDLAVTRKQQVAALNNAVITLNSSLQLEEILANLVSQFRLLTSAQICTVFLLDEDEKTLVARASNLEYRALGLKKLEEIHLVPSKGLMKRLKAGEQIMLDDLEMERQSQTPAGALYRRFDIQSALLLPISRQDRLMGMMVVYTPGQRDRFQPEEIGLLAGLASQAAAAIHNARLHMDLQQALEQQKELDRLKDDFIVTASHEFRTPLSAIHGYASLLERHSAKLTAEQAKRFSNEITRATHQLVGMVQSMMDASRIDAHKLSLSLQTVEVRPLAEGALALVQPDLQQAVHLDIAAGVWVSADPDRLRQVMTNLLSNAAKYSPASRVIDFVARIERQFTPPESALPTKPARPASQPTRGSGGLAASPHAGNTPALPPGETALPANKAAAAPAPGGKSAPSVPASLGHLVVSVIDRGEGIAPEDQKHLFQKFVRLQKSLTTPVRGTGLGLYICRQYLAAMGGVIWVESTPGQGATFCFALPLVAAPT